MSSRSRVPHASGPCAPGGAAAERGGSRRVRGTTRVPAVLAFRKLPTGIATGGDAARMGVHTPPDRFGCGDRAVAGPVRAAGL